MKETFPKRQLPSGIFCLSESRVLRNVKHFLVKREKCGAAERIVRMIFLSRKMAFVRKQDLSRGTILYTLHPVWFIFQTWLNQNKLGKLPSRSSFSNTACHVRICVFGEAARGATLFLKWNPKLSLDDDDGRNF